jgi:hypothetical protein
MKKLAFAFVLAFTVFGGAVAVSAINSTLVAACNTSDC